MDNKPEEQQKPQARKITSMVAFKKEEPTTTWVQVKHDGDNLEIEVERISYSEWMGLDHDVPYPERMKAGMGTNGAVYDYSHPDYQKALRERMVKVGMRRLARCLKAETKGDTIDEKADWLFANFSVGLLGAIVGALNELHAEGEATILQRRDSFPSNGADPTASDGEIIPDA